jgi:hypothetical protein
MKKYYSDKAAAKPSEAKWSAASIQKMEKAEQRRKEILEANPKYQQFFNYYKSFPELEKKTWDMAIKVSSEIQKVYPLMYKENAKTDKEPNPCKSFVL